MRNWNRNPALLALEDGRTFHGRSWAAEGECTGEMVFNTSMTGYQEVLTDPSYAGQIVCMTYPLIGNYGVNSEDEESDRPWVEGFVVREASRTASSWRAHETLDAYLKRWNIVAIDGIDTRALVRHIRDKGAMRACLSTIDLNKESVIEKLRRQVINVFMWCVTTSVSSEIHCASSRDLVVASRLCPLQLRLRTLSR